MDYKIIERYLQENYENLIRNYTISLFWTPRTVNLINPRSSISLITVAHCCFTIGYISYACNFGNKSSASFYTVCFCILNPSYKMEKVVTL